MLVTLVYNQDNYSPSRSRKRRAQKIIFVTKKEKIQNFLEEVSDLNQTMAKKFFPDDWETIAQDELIRSRARLSGFIEAIPDTKDDKDKLIKDVSIEKPIFRNVRAYQVLCDKNSRASFSEWKHKGCFFCQSVSAKSRRL